MTSDEMSAVCERCSFDEKKQLANRLMASIRAENNMRRDADNAILSSRCGELLAAAASVWGITPEPQCRKYQQVWSRAFVLHQLIDEGVTVGQAAKALRKERTTCLHLLQNMRFFLQHPEVDAEVSEKWLEFQHCVLCGQ